MRAANHTSALRQDLLELRRQANQVLEEEEQQQQYDADDDIDGQESGNGELDQQKGFDTIDEEGESTEEEGESIHRHALSTFDLPRRMLTFLVANRVRCFRLFESMDTARRGVLWKDEFEQALRILGAPVTDDEIEKLYDDGCANARNVSGIDYQAMFKQLPFRPPSASRRNNSDHGNRDIEKEVTSVAVGWADDYEAGRQALLRIQAQMKQTFKRANHLEMQFLVRRKHKVTRTGFRMLMEKNGFIADPKDVALAFKYLDCDNNGKASLGDIVRLKRPRPMLDHSTETSVHLPQVANNESVHATASLRTEQQETRVCASNDTQSKDGSQRTCEQQLRMANMMAVKTVLMREGYIARLRKLLELVPSDGPLTSQVDRGVSAALVNLVGELKRISEEAVQEIQNWRAAAQEVQRQSSSASTCDDGGAEEGGAHPAFHWKNQNYLLQMGKDLDWLQHWRTVIVSALADTVSTKQLRSLDEMFPTPVANYTVAERVIIAEARSFSKEPVGGQDSVAKGKSSNKDNKAPVEDERTFLGRVLAHTVAQVQLEMNMRGSRRGSRGATQGTGQATAAVGRSPDRSTMALFLLDATKRRKPREVRARSFLLDSVNRAALSPLNKGTGPTRMSYLGAKPRTHRWQARVRESRAHLTKLGSSSRIDSLLRGSSTSEVVSAVASENKDKDKTTPPPQSPTPPADDSSPSGENENGGAADESSSSSGYSEEDASDSESDSEYDEEYDDDNDK